jgi:cytochrome c
MNSFEINKIAGGILATLLTVMGLSFIADTIFAAKKPAKPGFEIVVTEKASTAVAAEPAKPIAELLAVANIEKGASIGKQCTTCHALEKGVVKATGPALYGILERDKGGAAFGYSAGMKAKGGKWGYEELNAFLENPKAYVAGTSMSYAGLRKASDRADVILYLRSLADAPAALPK